jgi:hypothetical protein
MTDPGASTRRRGGFWLTVGEVAAVIAVLIAGLNYWESRREHAEETRKAAEAAQVRSAIVLKGAVDAAGRQIGLEAVEAGQVIQSQRFAFPTSVLDHPVEITAAKPRIELNWIEGGLSRALTAAGVKGDGEARLPVAITTTYVEDGDTHIDQSIYLVGVSYHRRFLAPRQIALQGLALKRRNVAGDVQDLVNAAWKPPQPTGGGPT